MALRNGNRVVATAGRLNDLLPLVKSYGRALIPVELDVNDESADHETVRKVIATLGRLDVVVNAAGYDKASSFDDESSALECVQTNLFGALWVSQAALDYMGAQTGGQIVQIFGLANFGKSRNRRLYDACHRSVVGFSEHLAREVAPFGVEVKICVPPELYREWLDDNSVRTYTLDVFDPEGAECGAPFSGSATVPTHRCSNSAQASLASDS
jgi:NAD(P)-dependent dehydrogenase (short-subunit alcohol dehydrogenase family)